LKVKSIFLWFDYVKYIIFNLVKYIRAVILQQRPNALLIRFSNTGLAANMLETWPEADIVLHLNNVIQFKVLQQQKKVN
jgi:hypothetical protein